MDQQPEKDMTIWAVLSFILCFTVFVTGVIIANCDQILDNRSLRRNSPTLYNLLFFVTMVLSFVGFFGVIYLVVQIEKESDRKYLNDMARSQRICGDDAYWSEDEGECVDFPSENDYKFKYRFRKRYWL